MPEIEIFEDKTIMAGKRRRGRDESVGDAFKTMERLSDWFMLCRERDPWTSGQDPLDIAMLYGMLLHLREEIDRVMEQGGDQARGVFEFFRGAPPPSD